MGYGSHAEGRGSGALRTLTSVVLMIAFVVACTLFLRTFVFRPYEIPSGSMEQTIQVGDMLFSEKVSYYFRDPEPGDIVTFEDPQIPGRILIKRCIATAGQTVYLNDQDGLVYVDGVALDEPYTSGEPSYTLAGGVSFPYTVPDGCIWVMGDNRTNSQDSRYFGAVETSSVTGRAALVYWPISSFGLLD